MILVTGAAGFIGFHTIKTLLQAGRTVVGIDNLNDYYDVGLKKARLQNLREEAGFTFYEADIADQQAMAGIMAAHKDIDGIIHLAAQAGVRYSLEHPYAYESSNLKGHLVMLECARHCEKLKHFVYASSSSVYGGNTKQPFAETDPVNEPVSLYAATKRANELMTQSYAHLYGFPATGLRFFTVYGPWGRPDMAYFLFADAIMADKKITVNNGGDMRRDFTYIDDCVAGIVAALDTPPVANGKYCIGDAPHRLFNLGNNKAENLTDFIACIEKTLGRTARKIMAPMAPGDVRETYADITAAQDILDYNPRTTLSEGIPAFAAWYLDYYGHRNAA